MLLDSNMPESLWAEAINTAVYLKNRSPSNLLKEKTPNEKWYGKRPKVSHLRIFGLRKDHCLRKVIVLRKDQNRSKFK